MYLKYGTAHSDLVSKKISIHPEKVLFSFEAKLNTVLAYSYMYNQTAWVALS